jgi:hypothetical protein
MQQYFTQTVDHKVTIIATDSSGNETEQLNTVSIKKALSTSIAWSGIGDDNKINANEMAATTLSGISLYFNLPAALIVNFSF